MVNTFIALSARNGSGLLLVAMDRIIAVTADGSGSTTDQFGSYTRKVLL